MAGVSDYKLGFRNTTSEGLWFVLYQYKYTYDGQDSVAWKVRGVPSKGSDSVPWTLNYGVALVDFQQDPVKRYTITQGPFSAELGQTYEVLTGKSGIQSISPTSIGPAPSSKIVIVNNTTPGEELSVGITLNDCLIAAEHGVGGGMVSAYDTYKDYFVDCYTNRVTQGEVVSRYSSSGLESVDAAFPKKSYLESPGGPNSNAILSGPNVIFDTGVHELTVEALVNDLGKYDLKVV